jgi:hypothetical protein
LVRWAKFKLRNKFKDFVDCYLCSQLIAKWTTRQVSIKILLLDTLACRNSQLEAEWDFRKLQILIGLLIILKYFPIRHNRKFKRNRPISIVAPSILKHSETFYYIFALALAREPQELMYRIACMNEVENKEEINFFTTLAIKMNKLMDLSCILWNFFYWFRLFFSPINFHFLPKNKIQKSLHVFI